MLAPVVGGTLIAAALATGALGLQALLRQATPSEVLTARVIGSLDRLGSTRGLVTLNRHFRARVMCTRTQDAEQISVDGRLQITIRGFRARWVGRADVDPGLLAAEADLAGCPRYLADALAVRLLTGRPTLESSRRMFGRPVLVFLLSRGTMMVQLVVQRRDLIPLAVTLHSRRIDGLGAFWPDGWWGDLAAASLRLPVAVARARPDAL